MNDYDMIDEVDEYELVSDMESEAAEVWADANTYDVGEFTL